MVENKTSPRQVVVMTGATSGLGAYALNRFMAQPNMRVIIGARETGVEGVESLLLDLASLANVRAFAEAVKQRLGDDRIDMLVLNAGAQYRNGKQSADGFEATFAVNHLAHYLLARLLLSNMAEGARLVITTSDTHDPAIVPFAPKTLDIQQLAHPTETGSSASMRAYPASKLCNILTARAFAALEEVKAKHIRVIAYNPGLTFGTRLGNSDAQRQSPPRTLNPFARVIMGVIGRFNGAFYPGTPERAGEALAQLTLGIVTLPPQRIYASLVRGEITFPDPSKLAQSDEARDRLWRESAAMVGIDKNAA